MLYLIEIADQFISKRNWWQFHNPKNDALNIIVEAGELAEHFIKNNELEKKKIAEEISDVLFGSFCFALLTKIDIPDTINLISNKSKYNLSFEDLKKTILNHLDKFNLKDLKSSQQIIFSLIWQTSKLADIFIWCTVEQSILREKEKHSLTCVYIANIIAHLIYLSHLIDIDLPKEFIRKMELNNSKYPVNKSSGKDYIAIKDKSNKHK